MRELESVLSVSCGQSDFLITHGYGCNPAEPKRAFNRKEGKVRKAIRALNR